MITELPSPNPPARAARRLPPEARARLRATQIQAIADHSIFTSLAMIALALGIAWWFEGRADPAMMTGWVSLTVLVNLASLTWCRILRQRSRIGPVGASDTRWLAVSIGACALVDLSVVHYLLGIATANDAPLLVGIAAGVFATGGWLCSPLPVAGLSWTLTACLALIVQLLASEVSYAVPLAVLTFLYGLVLLVGIALTARVYENKHLAREQLRSEHELVNLLLRDFEQHSSDWLWETDAAGVLRYLSPQAAHVFGSATLGQPWLRVLADRAPDDGLGPDSGHQRLAAALRGFVPFRDLCIAVLVDQQPAWWSLTATPLVDGDGHRDGWRGVGSDVTLLRQRERALEQLATTDPVTGLANRLQIGLHLQAAFETLAQRSPFALLLLDLDRFSTLNESLGHAAGDALLRECADRLRNAVPAHAIVARLGGGSFAVLMPAPVTHTGIDELGHALVDTTSRPYEVAGQPLAVQVCLGVAFAPAHAQDPAELMDMAGLALQSARRPGHEPMCWFEASLREAARQRQALHAELREALRREQFELAYLPRFAVDDGRLLGFQVLPVWPHPRRGRLAAGEFTALAEGSGLAVAIGHWTLARACHDAASWGAPAAITLRLGRVEVSHSSLVHAVTGALHDSGLAANRLQLEIAESTMLEGYDGLVTALALLHALGVQVVLAEPACAPGSPTALRALPLDAVKLSLPAEADPGDAEVAALVLRARLALARSLDLPAIADGVTDRQQLATLGRAGFVSWQGPATGEPLGPQAAALLVDAKAMPMEALSSVPP